MRVLSADAVKQLYEESGNTVLKLTSDIFITKGAKRYMDENGLSVCGTDQRGLGVTEKWEQRAGHLKTAQGSAAKKPEHMTHLYGTTLVVKNHPSIVLRGKLDSFQGKLLEAQLTARKLGDTDVYDGLQAVLEYCRLILIAEVTEKPLEETKLLGMTEHELRVVSQHPKEHFGVGHVPPTADMGELCVTLNSLRAQSREVELAAITAFCRQEKDNKGKDSSYNIEREDILRALNRLSSGIYILFCKQLSKKLVQEEGGRAL